MPDLRETEAQAAAGLRRLTLERESLDAESERARQMIERLETQIATIKQDAEREKQSLSDAEQQLARLAEEEQGLKASVSDSEAAEEQAAADTLKAAADVLAEAETAFEQAGQAAADYRARKQALEQAVAVNQARRDKLLAGAQSGRKHARRH